MGVAATLMIVTAPLCTMSVRDTLRGMSVSGALPDFLRIAIKLFDQVECQRIPGNGE